ncbi:MAG TPA: HAD-IIIA family hydrolase [Candidatus Binataceae bacterium]|nr:HAD-IIIA family hydrolase [Candidatus Binataceae bacterium]
MVAVTGNRGLFLDLVGTLVAMDETRQLPLDERGRIVIELMPGVADKLAPIRDHLILVVSNQAGIKRGRLTAEAVEDALRALDERLGGILSGWQVCPHDDDDQCACRKPRAGMIHELAEMYGVDLALSTMVGDQEVDAEAAQAAGIGHFIYAKDFFGWPS